MRSHLSALVASLLSFSIVSAAETTVTLEAYVASHNGVLDVLTVTETHKYPGKSHGNQANNLEVGNHVLDLSHCQLTDIGGISTLPVQVCKQKMLLKQVKNLHLFLNNNQLTALPAELKDLDGMIFLYCYHNQLSKLPPELGGMTGLQGVYFTDNKFKEVPAVVLSLPNLRKCQFSQNCIRTLPDNIGALSKLIHFNVCSNQIDSLPMSFTCLKCLRVCDLSHNPLKSLPDGFGAMKFRYELRLRYCLLVTLPKGLANIDGVIDVSGSPIQTGTLDPQLMKKVRWAIEKMTDEPVCASTHANSKE